MAEALPASRSGTPADAGERAAPLARARQRRAQGRYPEAFAAARSLHDGAAGDPETAADQIDAVVAACDRIKPIDEPRAVALLTEGLSHLPAL